MKLGVMERWSNGKKKKEEPNTPPLQYSITPIK
jgi:hypothetical protein